MKIGALKALIPDSIPSLAQASKSIPRIHSAGFKLVDPFEDDVATTAQSIAVSLGVCVDLAKLREDKAVLNDTKFKEENAYCNSANAWAGD